MKKFSLLLIIFWDHIIYLNYCAMSSHSLIKSHNSKAIVPNNVFLMLPTSASGSWNHSGGYLNSKTT